MTALRLPGRPVRRLRGRVTVPATGVPSLIPERIPARQRAALAWILRDMLARADLRAADYNEYPIRREQVRVDNMRGEVLGLVAELESGTQQRKG